MSNTEILTQVDINERIAIDLVIKIFIALIVALAFLFAIVITIIKISCVIIRKVIILVMTSKQTASAFAMVGGHI